MAQHDHKKGTWVIKLADRIIIENSEIKALRIAVERKGSLSFVEWGEEIRLDHDMGSKRMPMSSDRPN